ncbi:MAG: hypothetical protein SFY96_03900 [Planctomycetota bacterium]|nr:hypothetical protein [Planctomycetota bacterium]
MPPLSTISVVALRDLAEQLRFAPREAIVRDIERAEQLAQEIDHERRYPPEWIVFRVTGYRPDAVAEDAPVVGSTLLADLSAFVERLCDATRLSAADVPDAIDAVALATKWNVSRKTLDRHRRRGLVARRVYGARGSATLVFMPRVVAHFENAHATELGRAAAFSRIPVALAARLERRAARYHASLGWSLNQCAQRLAERFDRSHEAVRQVLRRAEERAAREGREPVFAERGPISARDRAMLFRCWQRGLEPGAIATRLECSRASALRAINLERAARLRSLLDGHLARVMPPVRVNLDHAACATGLGGPGAANVAEFIADAQSRHPAPVADEHARIAAYRSLCASAAGAIGELDRLHPSAEAIDEIETQLRWASRVKAELMRPLLALVVATLSERLGSGLERLEPSRQIEAIRAALAGLSDAVEAHDPSSAPGRGGRLAGAASLAIDRAVVRWLKDAAPTDGASVRRARSATRIGVAALADWTRTIDPWQAWLEPDHRIRAISSGLNEFSRRVLDARFGWSGGPPMNAGQIGELIAQPRMRAAMIERRALREARALARGQVQS